MSEVDIGPRPAPPVGSCRVSLGGTYLSHKWAIIFWLNLTTTTPAQADLQTLATKIGGSWTTNMVPSVTAGTIVNTVALVWTPTTGQELLASDTTSRPGTLAGTEMSNSASCFVVNHRTGAYYRGGHSRSYIPGLDTSVVTNGSTISGARAGQLATAFTNFVTTIKTGPAGGITAIDVGTVRFKSKGAWLVPPVFVSWQSHSVRTTLGTQRGRLTE